MPRDLRLLLAGALILTLPLSAPAEDAAAPQADAIRFNISPKGYPPFTIVHDDGSVSGIVWDIFTLAAERLDRHVVAVQIPRKRVDDFLLEGRIDATARAIEWTEQPHRFAFTEPLLVVQEVFFKPADSQFRFSSLEALEGKTVLTHLGYEYPRLEPLFSSGKVERFDVRNELEMLHYLLKGEKFDLAVAVQQVGLWHIRQQGWKAELDYVTPPLSEQGYRLMFRKDQQELVSRLNAELEKIEKSGELAEILDRYR